MTLRVEDSADWAERNFRGCVVGDARRSKRLVQVAQRMAEKPHGSSPDQLVEWAELKAAYRLLAEEEVTFTAICTPHWRQTCAAARGRVLVIGDTTEISYGRKRQITGLGPVGRGDTQGFLLHSALLVQADTGEVLGLGAQELFYRHPVPSAETRRESWQRPRESEVWGRVIDLVGSPVPETTYVHVLDRGADNLEVFCHLRALGCGWVVRAGQLQRRVCRVTPAGLSEAQPLAALLPRQPILGEYTLELSARRQQPARKARVVVRAMAVCLPRPRGRTPYLKQIEFEELRQQVVEVRELGAPRGVEPLHWVLWTSLPVQTFKDAWNVIGDYERRWLIEEFHKALKTGCALEERQHRTAQSLAALTGLSSVLALRLIQLKQLARAAPEIPAAQIVPRDWLRMLEVLREKRLPTVRDFFRQLAGLGGFLLRKRDGEPGWITLWRGLEKLLLALRGARAFNQKCG